MPAMNSLHWPVESCDETSMESTSMSSTSMLVMSATAVNVSGGPSPLPIPRVVPKASTPAISRSPSLRCPWRLPRAPLHESSPTRPPATRLGRGAPKCGPSLRCGTWASVLLRPDAEAVDPVPDARRWVDERLTELVLDAANGVAGYERVEGRPLMSQESHEAGPDLIAGTVRLCARPRMEYGA